MAIKDLQQRLTQVGVIRLGRQLVSKNGKNYPAKLETFRFTSPSKPLIEALAKLYGGAVQPWQSNVGPQWEVVSGVSEIPVMVPPQRIDPNMEHWGNGFRDRMCDGETESIRQAPCLCAQMQAAGRRVDVRELCKPTTRMALMLAEAPGMGTFKIESHGWNAAAELPTLAASIESAPQPIPARLEVQKREKKTFDPNAKEGEQVASSVFMVPVLHFDWLTPAQAFGGELGSAARAALGASTAERHAIEAAKVESQRRKFTPDEYLTMVEDAKNLEQVRTLWNDAGKDGALTAEVKAALETKAAGYAPKPAAKPVEQPPAPAAPVVPDDVVDAEEAPDPDAVWAQIQAVAGEHGWNAEQLDQRVAEFLKKPSTVADGFELARFLGAVQAGEVK